MTQHEERRAAVIVFPTARRIGRAHRVAEVLSQQPTRHAVEVYWSRVVGDMRKQMERAGVDPETIEHQVADFRRVVESILAKRGATA